MLRRLQSAAVQVGRKATRTRMVSQEVQVVGVQVAMVVAPVQVVLVLLAKVTLVVLLLMKTIAVAAAVLQEPPLVKMQAQVLYRLSQALTKPTVVVVQVVVPSAQEPHKQAVV